MFVTPAKRTYARAAHPVQPHTHPVMCLMALCWCLLDFSSTAMSYMSYMSYTSYMSCTSYMSYMSYMRYMSHMSSMSHMSYKSYMS